MHTNSIGRLYCDNLNRIWAIGAYANEGLSVYNGTWQPFSLNSSVPKPGYLFQDAANNIYIAEGLGNIYKYDGTTVQLLLQTPDQRIWSAIFDQNGIMWVLSGSKLLKYDVSTLLETTILNPNGVGSFYLIEKDRLGKLWILIGNSLYKSDDLLTFNILGSIWNYYMDVAFDSNNNAFFGRYSKASGGIKTYIGSTWGEYTSSNGLTSVTVQAVAIDNSDKVWVGADDGLYRSSSAITGFENAKEDNFNIYPNPVTTDFSIRCKEGFAQLSLIDLNGKELFTKQVNTNENISISTLPQGVYVLKIATENGLILKKLVKQ